MQSSNILSDNIPIKSYRESFQRTEEKNMFTNKKSFSSQEQKDEMLIFFCGEHSTADSCFIMLVLQTKTSRYSLLITKGLEGHITFSLESKKNFNDFLINA